MKNNGKKYTNNYKHNILWSIYIYTYKLYLNTRDKHNTCTDYNWRRKKLNKNSLQIGGEGETADDEGGKMKIIYIHST